MGETPDERLCNIHMLGMQKAATATAHSVNDSGPVTSLLYPLILLLIK